MLFLRDPRGEGTLLYSSESSENSRSFSSLPTVVEPRETSEESEFLRASSNGDCGWRLGEEFEECFGDCLRECFGERWEGRERRSDW